MPSTPITMVGLFSAAGREGSPVTIGSGVDDGAAAVVVGEVEVAAGVPEYGWFVVLTVDVTGAVPPQAVKRMQAARLKIGNDRISLLFNRNILYKMLWSCI